MHSRFAIVVISSMILVGALALGFPATSQAQAAPGLKPGEYKTVWNGVYSEAQAARGEAATFWRGCAPGGAEAAQAQALAISLSRFATLFPYPMGGAPNSRGVRSAGAAILRDALAQIER